MHQTQQRHSWLVSGLIVLGVVARVVPHPWNATPLVAIALFGGTYLSPRLGIALPLCIVALSDILLGWHNTIAFTWVAFALTGLLSWWIRRNPGMGRIVACAVSGSVAFFLITNFGVWWVGGLYPRTTAGLWECYMAAIPFFRNMLLGDLAWTAALFGGYALATRSLSLQKA